MPLPTPLELNMKTLGTIIKHADCRGTWEQHPGPLTLEEFMAIKKEISVYLTETANAFIEELHK